MAFMNAQTGMELDGDRVVKVSGQAKMLGVQENWRVVSVDGKRCTSQAPDGVKKMIEACFPRKTKCVVVFRSGNSI